jgi:hypothetical protein
MPGTAAEAAVLLDSFLGADMGEGVSAARSADLAA